MKVLSEKMNVMNVDTSKLTKAQMCNATSDAISQKFKKVCIIVVTANWYIHFESGLSISNTVLLYYVDCFSFDRDVNSIDKI